MTRIARIVVPGAPHHVTQRGARRMKVFFCDGDYEHYRSLLLEQLRRYNVSLWTYCLMPNHVHLIAVPEDREGLARALAAAHRRYALQTNARQGWRGHLWQERFWSFPMSEASVPAVTRYVLLNPVRAGLVRRSEEWRFSSVRHHLGTGHDPLVDGHALDSRIADWARLLEDKAEDSEAMTVRTHSSTGRPMGNDRYVSGIEELVGRKLRPRRSGRPRRGK